MFIRQSSTKEDRYDFFLAHASDDRDVFVVPLVKSLRAAGVSVWYSQFDSPFSSEKPATTDKALHTFLEDAIKRCSAGIIVASPRFLEKPWPVRELKFWMRDPARRKRLFLVLLGVGIDDISRVAGPVVHQLSLPSQAFASSIGVLEIAAKVISTFEKRAVMHGHKFRGPTNIVVFREYGMVAIGHSGGLFARGPNSHLDFFDFSGKQITDRADRVLQAFLQPDQPSPPGQTIDFEEDIFYAHVNHLHMQIFTPQQVQRGSLFNFGTNDAPRVLIPFYTCDCYTGGILKEEVDPYVQQCLARAKGSYKGNWKRFVVNDDQSYFVIGSE